MIDFEDNLLQEEEEEEEEPDFLGNICVNNKPVHLLYITIAINNIKMKALVDSGAARTFVNLKFKSLACSQNLKIKKVKPMNVKSPLGTVEKINEVINLPISFCDRRQKLKARIVPSLDVPIILGLDALRAFGMVINFNSLTWYFSSNPSKTYLFENNDPISNLDEESLNGLMELSPSEKAELDEFLKRELPPVPTKPGLTHLVEHHIDVNGHPAIRQKNYPVSKAVEEAMHKEVDRMLADGIIEPSSSDWSSPIVMIKKNDKYRFCLDFRKVNSVTKKDAYPVPHLQVLLGRLRDAKLITTLDLNKAFHQIKLTESSKEITGFTIQNKGLFHFKRLPFGLCNAPSSFQRLIDKVIGPDMAPHVYAYLDDIIIISDDFQSHLYWLKRVLDKLKEAGLTINADKSHFCTTEVKYLGFLINEDGLKTDPDKIAPIKEYPAPRTLKQVRRLIGMAS